jgi:hypothetical protein
MKNKKTIFIIMIIITRLRGGLYNIVHRDDQKWPSPEWITIHKHIVCLLRSVINVNAHSNNMQNVLMGK